MTDYAKPSFHAEDNEWSDEETEKWRYTSGAYYTKDALSKGRTDRDQGRREA